MEFFEEENYIEKENYMGCMYLYVGMCLCICLYIHVIK